MSEYITVVEKNISIKARNISFEQVAAMPVVGSAVLQMFKELVSLEKGTEILINGASGGIGYQSDLHAGNYMLKIDPVGITATH